MESSKEGYRLQIEKQTQDLEWEKKTMLERNKVEVENQRKQLEDQVSLFSATSLN